MRAPLRSNEPILKFGTFELLTATGELRKEGQLIRLRHQPAQVLRLLLEKPGALVTRAEMISALWPDDLDVDVEQGLNHCVKEIRAALGDRAGAPRFIQTFPRRGYRFLAEVRVDRPRTPDPERHSESLSAPDHLITETASHESTNIAHADPGHRGQTRAGLEDRLEGATTGTVAFLEAAVRVQVLLCRADDGAVLWSETYDRRADEAPLLAQDVAAGVSAGLSNLLSPAGEGACRADDDDGLGSDPRFE